MKTISQTPMDLRILHYLRYSQLDPSCSSELRQLGLDGWRHGHDVMGALSINELDYLLSVIALCRNGMIEAEGNCRDVESLPTSVNQLIRAKKAGTALLVEYMSHKATALDAQHAPDFRSVLWKGKAFNLSPNQAAVIKILWENAEKGTPDVSWEFLRAEVEIESERMVDAFKGLSARRDLISEGATIGTWRMRMD